MPRQPKRLRPYRASGLHAVAPTPAQRHAADTLRGRLIADHLHGGEPSAAQGILLGLLAAAAIRHRDAWDYLLTQPRPWVNKKARRAIGLVHDLSKHERHVARLVAALMDPALDRKPQPIETIRDLAARLEDEPPAAPDAAPEPDATPPAA